MSHSVYITFILPSIIPVEGSLPVLVWRLSSLCCLLIFWISRFKYFIRSLTVVLYCGATFPSSYSSFLFSLLHHYCHLASLVVHLVEVQLFGWCWCGGGDGGVVHC